MKDVTAIVQTFKRPECLNRLLDSLKLYYPEMKVIVNDDSETDKGVSWGRNHLVSQVKTPYYLILDDDFVFTYETKIEYLKEKIEKGYDLVAGSLRQNGEVINYEGRLRLEDNVLKLDITTEEPLDIVFQFFLAKTNVTGWDETIKIGEHTAFFWEHKGEWKIGYEPNCIVTHLPIRSDEYISYRGRAADYIKDWFAKKGITKDINYGTFLPRK